MRTDNLIRAVALFLALGSGVPALAANPPLDYKAVVKADADLSPKINQQLLADTRLSAKDWEGLTITVKNGAVVMRGHVTTDAAMKEVKRIARLYSDRVDDFPVTSDEAVQRDREQNCCG